MQVTVKLYALFRWRLFREAVREYPPGAAVSDVARDLEITETEIGIVLVNGLHADLGHILQEGDLVSLMPRIGGG
ncbi:MAG TPA: molybdopterin synthase sulfur carrier subunit [Geobacter sp.]|nr:molybdopterin synthase sulfur carrier subunit [Geobacter sp.]